MRSSRLRTSGIGYLLSTQVFSHDLLGLSEQKVGILSALPIGDGPVRQKAPLIFHGHAHFTEQSLYTHRVGS